MARIYDCFADNLSFGVRFSGSAFSELSLIELAYVCGQKQWLNVIAKTVV